MYTAVRLKEDIMFIGPHVEFRAGSRVQLNARIMCG